MAKNLRKGHTVYQVRDGGEQPMMLHKGFISDMALASQARVQWLEPRQSKLCGVTTVEYMCDLYRTPQRAITAYIRRAKNNLMIQADEMIDAG